LVDLVSPARGFDVHGTVTGSAESIVTSEPVQQAATKNSFVPSRITTPSTSHQLRLTGMKTRNGIPASTAAGASTDQEVIL
jgi:hypothetical protein